MWWSAWKTTALRICTNRNTRYKAHIWVVTVLVVLWILFTCRNTWPGMARETSNYTVLLYSACLDQGVWSGKKMQLIGWELLLQCKFLHTYSENHHFLDTLLLADLNSWIFRNIYQLPVWPALIIFNFTRMAYWTQTLQFIHCTGCGQ
jgi:hypothetical protein